MNRIKQNKLSAVRLALLASLTAFNGQAADDIAYLALGEQGYWQVWMLDSASAQSRQVTQSPYDKSNLSWYPDGQHLLVNGHQGELVKISLKQGHEQPVPLPFDNVHDAAMGPNGQKIAFSMNTSEDFDNNHLWLMDLRTQKPQKLTNMRGLQHEPRWTSDGKSFYFLSGEGGETHDIWRYTLESGSKQQITFNSLYNFDVAIANDGRLAFSSNRTGNYELWIRSTDGQLTQVTDDPSLDAGPAWSPDGQALVFQSSRAGNYNLWHLNLKNQEVKQLTKHLGGARKPMWRPTQQPSKDA